MSDSLIFRGIKGFFNYLFVHLIAMRRYDKKYLQGRWFEGKAGGICSLGWQWAAYDYRLGKRKNVNVDVPWPVSPDMRVACPENINFHPDDLNNFQNFGCYFQAMGKISIGKGTYIAPNVGIITANHQIINLDEHDDPQDVIIGENCWIGMNSVILPGVVLGDRTIVGAGSVVTKSFTDGHIVIAGNPAKELRKV